MPSLAARERIPEIMDRPDLDPAEHRRALAGLARINRWTFAARVLAGPIQQLAAELGRPVRVLDVATGSGDLPVQLARLAPSVVTGCDLSPTAVAAARGRGSPVEFFEHDILAADPPGRYDAVTCSLFLHHLDEADAVTVLRRMKAAADRLVLVCDLERSRPNYHLVWLACRLLSRSPVVHFDGPASVRSAFTPAEAIALAGRAGLRGATAARRWPFRFLLKWEKS